MSCTPLSLSDDRRFIFDSESDAPRDVTSPGHLKHETKCHMTKIKEKSRVYNECAIKELAKIFNMVLSP